jgi:hypothetical protein
MASTPSVLSPKAQTYAVVFFAATLLLSIAISGYAPLVWFAALVATIVTCVVIGRQRERAGQVAVDADDLNALMADGRAPEVIRDEAMAEARSNLKRCETAVLRVRFDGMAPMLVNDLRGTVGGFTHTNDPVHDALLARRVQNQSRNVLNHLVAKQDGNFIRTIGTVVGMFSSKS